MVMSMDAATDQAMGSPMDDSALSVRHQESADEELNTDEQSKASGQTVVDVDKNQQLALTPSFQSSHDDIEAMKKQTETSSAMILSRESSFNEDDSDERKLMMHVDYEDKKQVSNKQIVKHKYEDRGDLETKDPLVARMRDIVEGNQPTTIHQCHHHHHHHQQQQQPKDSSGDSLNNQVTENNSKASIDSAQQKRSRQNRHCGRHHHHHHHHHRPSLGTNVNASQTTPTGHHHHHHHHHHRPMGHQHAHRHHHHHHHHPQVELVGPQTSAGEVFGGKRAPGQRPLDESEAYKQQASRSSFSQATEVSKQTGESKSSNSSVSSAPVDQHQVQQEAALSNENNSGTRANRSSEAINENLDLKDGVERCINHPTCHHHHSHSQAQNPHHHHHHHYHGRHHHHRNHKKRLVQDGGDDQQVEDQSSGPLANEKSDHGEGLTPEARDKQQDLVAERVPLQDIGPQVENLAQGTSSSYCPYHEHQCGHQPRGTKLHQHHCHHHHHPHGDSQMKRDNLVGEQQHRGHHHHHHHHHRHHHHGPHQNRTRARRHKSSSSTNINEPSQREHATDFELPMVDKDDSNKDKPQPTKDSHNNEVTCDRESSKHEQLDIESKMLLDNNDENRHLDPVASQISSTDNANSEVVNMEISPNSDNKQSPKSTKLSANEQLSSSSKSNQQVEDSDFGAQGASGSSDATKNNSVHGFTRNQEGDSMKQACDKSNRFVEQISRENSRKEMVSGAGAGQNKKQDQQQLIECSPVQPDTYQQLSQPKQIIESTVSPDRRCRLCWCCCCPCSGLSGRNNTGKAETKQNVIEAPSSANKCQTIPNIPLEKIRSWAESFDRLMKCPDGRRVFQDFLRCEYSEENILFWIACEELKNEKDAKSIATRARDIYEDYISILSAKEVSLDSRVRDIINNNIKKPTSNIFDEAQLQIYTLMHRDSYPRFINSPMYKKLAQIQSSSSRKGSS